MPERQKYLFPAPTWTEIAKAAREAIRAVKADFPEVADIHLAALRAKSTELGIVG